MLHENSKMLKQTGRVALVDFRTPKTILERNASHRIHHLSKTAGCTPSAGNSWKNTGERSVCSSDVRPI